MAGRAVATSKPTNVRFLEGSAERLPLDDRTVDAVSGLRKPPPDVAPIKDIASP
jgi:ubiquinone/menaquinone biosynthesis C-methylase UbiE